jgi:hypothetical protein
LLRPLGSDGGKTIVDDQVCEVRRLFRVARTTQRTIYRPGEISSSMCGSPRARCERVLELLEESGQPLVLVAGRGVLRECLEERGA